MSHSKSYIICATPRSGSTLLCDLLADTGVAGCPDSFFRRQSIPWWANYFNLSMEEWGEEHEFDQSYLAAVLQEGLDGTDVFGMRLMWESVGDLAQRLGLLYHSPSSDSARFQAAFGPLLYVHLSREDKVAQAISLVTAEQSGLWHVDADGSERERVKLGHAPVYDRSGLSEHVAELERYDAAWERWFAQERIGPVRITYEVLSREPQSTLATVLSTLGLDPSIAVTVKPRTMKLADTESREWAARFTQERNTR